MLEINKIYNMDCLDGMRLMKEQGIKADWLIADPPYGIGVGSLAYTNGVEMVGTALANRRDYSTTGEWDKERISKDIIDLMLDRSKNQIIFGGNYYTDYLPPTKSWIVWDKRSATKTDRNDFADCELAYCSKGVARVFNYIYNGMIQGDMKNKDYRFHPTQKPTQMYEMLLNYYTKEGDLILDPFAGSQSLRIACHKLHRRYIGFELDKDYYKQGCKWFEASTAQLSIF